VDNSTLATSLRKSHAHNLASSRKLATAQSGRKSLGKISLVTREQLMKNESSNKLQASTMNVKEND